MADPQILDETNNGVHSQVDMHLVDGRPRIIVDGVFYQNKFSGISRVWDNIFMQWTKSGFARYIVVLDRGRTISRIPGIKYIDIAPLDYRQTGRDSLKLEEICKDVKADLFVSTYYSTPTETPSVFFGYDMIPEVLGFDLKDEIWREKHRAIQHASSHMMISESSARDLERIMDLESGTVAVAHCGVGGAFYPPSEEEVSAFRSRYGLSSNYVLFVGHRIGFLSYKNAAFLVRAVERLPEGELLSILFVGGDEQLEPELQPSRSDIHIEQLALNDDDLRAAYGGARALVCISRYEGFGLGIVEAMACGCPVVASRNSSISEAAGDAALFIRLDDPRVLANTLSELGNPNLRADFMAKGLEQAAKFSFERMAKQVEDVFRETAARTERVKGSRPLSLWKDLREFQQASQNIAFGPPLNSETQREKEKAYSNASEGGQAKEKPLKELSQGKKRKRSPIMAWLRGIKSVARLPAHYAELRRVEELLLGLQGRVQQLEKRRERR